MDSEQELFKHPERPVTLNAIRSMPTLGLYLSMEAERSHWLDDTAYCPSVSCIILYGHDANGAKPEKIARRSVVV